MPSPLDNRLRVEYEKVQALVRDSGGTLKLVSSAGSPPSRYIIEYHCPSPVIDSAGKVSFRHVHQVEINLPSNYPFATPSAIMRTPVFNIHVFTHNAICLGDNSLWNAGMTLDTLILRIGALLQLDPKVINYNSAANSMAKEWTIAHKAELPVGKVTFMAAQPTEPKSRIQWS